jgi:hypothetical protein
MKISCQGDKKLIRNKTLKKVSNENVFFSIEINLFLMAVTFELRYNIFY